MMSNNNITVEYCQAIADNSSLWVSRSNTRAFFMMSLMAIMGVQQLTGLSVYLIDRVYRELKRAVASIMLKGTSVFFQILLKSALKHPNYSRWGSLFLHKLQQMDPKACDILEAGAMSIRHTNKSYARSAVDLTLEPTVNNMLHLQQEAYCFQGLRRCLQKVEYHPHSA